jgi:hypothetical protein
MEENNIKIDVKETVCEGVGLWCRKFCEFNYMSLSKNMFVFHTTDVVAEHIFIVTR